MADAKLTALTAASALAAADLFYVSQSAASRKATGTQLLALVGTTYVPLAGGTMTGALTLPAGAVGTPQLMFTGAGATTGLYSPEAGVISIAINNSQLLRVDSTSVLSFGSLGFMNVSTSAPFCFGSDFRLLLFRDAAAQLALRNGTTAQRMHIYGTYTDSSNYERLTLSTTAGTSVNITAETLGTGGDNLDIVLTPAGTGSVKFPSFTSDSAGNVTASNFICSNGRVGIGNSYDIRLGNTSGLYWTATTYNGTVDIALLRNAAGIAEVTNGQVNTYRDLKLRNLLNTEYHQMTEMTAPSAPATNSVRIYAEDNGAGKTRLMALFATGSAVQIAVEP